MLAPRRPGGDAACAQQAPECRICLEQGLRGDLVSPCDCDGSVRYTHPACIRRWILESGRTICEICHARYRGMDDAMDEYADIESANVRAVHFLHLDDEVEDEAHGNFEHEVRAVCGRLRSTLLLTLCFIIVFCTAGLPRRAVHLPSRAHARSASDFGGNETADLAGSPNALGSGEDLSGTKPNTDDVVRAERQELLRRRHEQGGLAWSRLLHVLFMLGMLRLVVLRQRQARLYEQGVPYDDDPFGLYDYEANPLGLPYDGRLRADGRARDGGRVEHFPLGPHYILV